MGKSSKQPVQAAPSASSNATSAADDNPTAALGGAMRQLIMLPVLWTCNKIDFTQDQNVTILRAVFATAMICGYLALTFCISKVKRRNDGDRVADPGTSMYLKDADKAADGSVSVRTYDNAKLQEAKMQFVMSGAISCFVHLQWGYTQPLVIMSIMQPLQLLDNKAVQVHLRGKSGPGYERPWKAAASGNPLAQWAENKKAEAERMSAAHAKKTK